MSNRLRFRSGQVHLHKLRVDSATVIEAGDMEPPSIRLASSAVSESVEVPFGGDGRLDMDRIRRSYADGLERLHVRAPKSPKTNQESEYEQFDRGRLRHVNQIYVAEVTATGQGADDRKIIQNECL